MSGGSCQINKSTNQGQREYQDREKLEKEEEER
jgi:hypothetical protein